MHLKNYPQYFVKDGERISVYFTGEARDLMLQGWVPVVKEREEKQKEVKKINAPPASVKIEPEVEDESEAESIPEFDFMTKAELIEYASGYGVELENSMLKAELVEACRKL